MSFLYQALLKNRQQEPAPQNKDPQPSGVYQPTVMMPPAASVSSHSGFWLTISILLLVVGLLAGYVFGLLQPGLNTQQPAQFAKPSTELPAPNKSEALVPAVPTQSAANEVAVKVNKQGNVEATLVGSSVPTESQAIDGSIDSDLVLNEQATAAEPDDGMGLDEISDELKASFAQAVAQTELQAEPIPVNSRSSLPTIDELTAAQKMGLPDLIFQMHIFATDPSERWVKINERVVKEGEPLLNGLTLVEVRQNEVVWQWRNSRFIQLALEDYLAKR